MTPAMLEAAPAALPHAGPAASALPFYRELGRTGLKVSCLGIGGGGAVSSADVLYAYSKGINYFFFSSDLHHFLYSNMTEALRKLCGRGSAERENIVLGLVTYVKSPQMIRASIADQFLELGIDYIDVFYWGWVDTNDRAGFRDLMKLSPHTRGPQSRATEMVEQMVGVSERLKRMGAIRYVGASFHDTEVAAEWIDSPYLDVAMVRHNPSHRSAQRKIFQPLQDRPATRPGITTFKSNVGAYGSILNPPARLPAGCWVPSPGDLYRYSLSQPSVDVCLTGPQVRSHIDDSLAAVAQGRLTDDELRYLSVYGDLYRPENASRPVPFESLMFR